MMFKKAVSPIAQVVILLIVTVASIISFQTWYSNLGSEIFSSAEVRNEELEILDIDLIPQGVAYIINKQIETISGKELLINSDNCISYIPFEPGTTSVDISNCILNTNTTQIEITAITDKGVFSKKFFVERQKISVPIPRLIWNVTFDEGIVYDYSTDVVTDEQNSIYISGRSRPGSRDDFLVFKLYSNGTEAWRNIIDNGNYFESAEGITYNNGKVYVAGRLYPGGVGAISLVIYNSTTGAIIGTPIYNTAGLTGTSVDFDSNGDIYVAGQIGGSRISKYDDSGVEIWDQTYPEVLGYPLAIKVDSNDDLILGGYLDSDLRAFIMKANSSGGHLWNYNISVGGVFDQLWDIETDSQNNIYGIGHAFSPGYVTTQAFMVKLDSMGNEIFSFILENSTSFNRIQRVGNSLYISEGVPSRNGGIIKYDLNGNEIYRYNYSTEIVWGIAVDNNADIVATGHFGTDMRISKFRER